MNKVILSGYVGKEVSVRESQSGMKVARYSLAVRRMTKKEGEQDTDWISLIAFDKKADFAEKYVKKGTRLIVEGHITTGSFTNKDGQKVYTTDVIVDSQEFAESKKNAENQQPEASNQSENNQPEAPDDGCVNVSDDIDEEMPVD